MQFTKHQNKTTRAIVAWFVDGEKVTESQYEASFTCCQGEGMKYNSSVTTSEGDNYAHSFSMD